MKKAILLFCVFFGADSALRAQEPSAEQIEKWRTSLGSNDYETRTAAMKEMWEKGEDALPFLNELSKDLEPEVAARASAVFQRVRVGIMPDTPEKVVALIDQYLESSPTGRVAVLERLSSLGEFDFILRLRRDETSGRVIDRMDSMISKMMPRIVRGYLNEDQLRQAKDVLALSEKYEHMIHLGHLLDLSGELDGEIDRLRKEGDDEKISKRYLAYLRVKGDAGLLRREAARLGDRPAEVLAAIADGDHTPYFEYLLEVGKLGLPSQNYLKWALADHRGDGGAKKEALEKIRFLSKQDNEERDGQLNLFRMGRGEEIVEGLGDGALGPKISYYLIQENYVKARDLIGLPDLSKLQEWLARVSPKVEQELKNGERGVETERMIAAVEFLEGRGLLDEASEVALAFFEVARGKTDFQLPEFGREMFYSAPIAVLTAAAREIEKHEANASSFLGEMLSSDKQHNWLYGRLGKILPKVSIRERLLLTCSFSSRHILVSPQRYAEVFDLVIESALKSENTEKELENLSLLLQYRNREDEMLRVCEEQMKEGEDMNYLMYLLALDGGRAQDAVNAIEKIEFTPDTVNHQFLMQKALALKNAGKKGWRDMFERALLLSSGTSQDLVGVSSQQLRIGWVEESHETLRKAFLRSASLPSPGDYSTLNSMIGGLSSGAATLKKWEEALAYREVSAAISLYGGVAGGVFAMRERFQVLVARGAQAMEEGGIVKAVEAFSEAHRILPRDGYLANELFPVVREVGLIELHDQLFARSAEHAREVVRLYPKDDNAHNNFAWLASRANRCLDEAEKYLKRALELQPQSAAYLDTMGEIYFARRNREEALKWSARSIKNEVLGQSASRWELHQQRRRFESGEFPVR